jgi:CheY-like chemotaxis protein
MLGPEPIRMKQTRGANKLERQRGAGGAGGARAISGLPLTVLHVDDDPNDTELLRAATLKARVDFILHNVEDGEQALAYLSGTGIYADRVKYPVPSLILLDLKMPRATGFEVLTWIRRHAELGRIPVVVLSGSELQDDVRQAYDIGANSYLVKPLGFAALVTMVKNIKAVWLNPIHPER